MTKHLTVKEFLQKVEDGELYGLDIYNQIEVLSSNFDPVKLRLLKDDVNVYLLKMQAGVNNRTSFLEQLMQQGAKNYISPKIKYWNSMRLDRHGDDVSETSTRFIDAFVDVSVAPERYQQAKAVRQVRFRIEQELKRLNISSVAQEAQPSSSKGTTLGGASVISPTPQTEEITQHKQIAHEMLAFLKGKNIQKTKIMPDEDYQRMLTYVDELIEKSQVPVNLTPIPQIGIPNGHLTYTFYQLHKRLYTTRRIRDEWIDFLREAFTQLNGSERPAFKKKFSYKPPAYDADLIAINKLNGIGDTGDTGDT